MIVATDLSSSAKHVAHVIGLHADRDLKSWPKQVTVAREMGLDSPRQVRRGVRELREAGVLAVQKNGPGRSATYTLLFPEQAAEEGPELRGRAAPLIRECWWRGDEPPFEGWNMGQEYSFLEPAAKRHGWPLILAAIPLVPSVFEMNGRDEGFTGKLVFSRKTRSRWNRCLDLARREVLAADDEAPDDEPGSRELVEAVEELV